jgi:SAM-dependent methyltransferase
MKRNTRCGICDGGDLTKVLSLGEMPLANAFLKKEDFAKEEKYPLDVYFCRTCKSVQLLDIVDPNIVFKKYEYLTSASKPLSEHFVKMGHELVDRFKIGSDDFVVEIGGNDGVLLDAIKHRCRVVNVEPAANAASISRAKGIETIEAFFPLKEGDTAELVIANNVMAHVSDIRGAFERVKQMIGDNGVFVFEVHWLGNLITTGGFDQIYHEHIYYHSLKALQYLVQHCGMNIFDVEMVPIHGESMRVFVSRHKYSCASVPALIAREKEMGLDKEETLTAFADKIYRNKKVLVELIRTLRRDRNKIVGYGAPAKGNTLLNHYGIMLDYIIDTTPGKQGLYTPGMHIPVYPPEKLLEDVPDYVILLAWNYANDILLKEQKLIERGVRFITPVPVVQITEGIC